MSMRWRGTSAFASACSSYTHTAASSECASATSVPPSHANESKLGASMHRICCEQLLLRSGSNACSARDGQAAHTTLVANAPKRIGADSCVKGQRTRWRSVQPNSSSTERASHTSHSRHVPSRSSSGSGSGAAADSDPRMLTSISSRANPMPEISSRSRHV